MRFQPLAVFAAMLAIGAASSAMADEYSFTFVGSDQSSLSFQLDSSSAFADNGGFIRFSNVQALYDGASFSDEIHFFPSSSNGGFNARSAGGATFQENTFGPQLYQIAGSELVFSQGVFDLSGAGGKASGTLTIADDTVSAAPEPGVWALMMLGVGAIGTMLGYRKRVLAGPEAKLAAIG